MAPPSDLADGATAITSAIAPRRGRRNAARVVDRPASAKNSGISNTMDSGSTRCGQRLAAGGRRAAGRRRRGRRRTRRAGAAIRWRRRSPAGPASARPARGARACRRAHGGEQARERGRARGTAARAARPCRRLVWPRPREPSPAPASATTTASRIHAITSTTAAPASESWPKAVCVIPRSLRMRAITGNAVIDSAAARNSAKGPKPTPAGASAGCSSGEIGQREAGGTPTLDADAARGARCAHAAAARGSPGR